MHTPARRLPLRSSFIVRRFLFIVHCSLFIVHCPAALSLPARASDAPIRVACVGDSITWGMTVEDPATESWPAQLQSLLGDGYDVRNFGVPGATLQKAGDFPYWKTPEKRESLAFQPDIVLILLGANDTKVFNWLNEARYRRHYRELIAAYRALPSSPAVYPMTLTVMKAVRDGNDNESFYDMQLSFHARIVSAIRQLAETDGLELIDLYGATREHAGELRPDGVHMTRESCARIAAAVRDVLLKDVPLK